MTELCAAVYGTDADFVLIGLPFDERATLALEYAAAHNLPYCGILGFFDGGTCLAKCVADEKAVSVMLSAAPHFAQYIASKLKGVIVPPDLRMAN